MRKFFLIYISLCAMCVQAENKITGYRYWFNQDIENLVTGSLTARNEVHLETVVVPANIPQGVNKLSIQFVDSDIRYSVPLTTYFLKFPVGFSEKSLITGYRYWMNNDTTATVVNITPSREANITAQLNLNNSINEVNIFRFQTIDEKNLWSVPVTTFIFGRQNLKMQKYQYWFNNNLKDAVTAETSNERSLQINMPINTTQLNDGLNMINVRFSDDLGIWSSTLTQFFYKSRAADGVLNRVKSVEYWFDNDIGGAVKTDLQPNSDIIWLGRLSADGVSVGLHRINIRFADDRLINSQLISAFFIKPTNEKYDYLVIDKIRYVMGNNFSLMVMNALQQAMASVSYNDELDLKNFRGIHAPLLVQFGDMRGLWSVPTTDSVLVPVNVGFEHLKGFVKEGSLRIFPNPNRGEFTVSIGDDFTEGILTIKDITGRVCFTQQGELLEEIKVKIEDFNPGVYFVKVDSFSGNTIAISKVIISK